MPTWMAAILGVVEGLTEFLPVSSTGHLVLAGHALGLRDEAAKTFEVVIQAGAILAVLVHYRHLLARRLSGLASREAHAMRLVAAIAAAFVPTAIAGVLLRKIVKRFLFGPLPVAAALVAGGVAMIVGERLLAKREREEIVALEGVDARKGFVIGCAQCLSLWPGTSRAMCTILAGRIVGLDVRTSAEFSFLLAIPVLLAATALDLYKGGRALIATADARVALAVGFTTSFVVAWAAIRWFLRFLAARGLAPFGWYRIALGIAVFVVLGRS